MSNISDINKKVQKFKTLKSAEEGIKFWEEELLINYIDFLADTNSFKDYKVFRLDSFKNDWGFLNKWILENYNSAIKPSESNNKQDKFYQLLSLRKLKEDLAQKRKRVENEYDLINEELKKIDDSLEVFSQLMINTNTTYDADSKSFKDYFSFHIKPDYSQIIPSIKTIEIENGKTLADYALHLLALRKKLLQKPSKKPVTEKLTAAQLAIFLHYTGLLDWTNNPNTLKAKVFSALTGTGYKNVYDSINDFQNKGAKKEDLEAILNYMEEHELNKLSYKLREDLKNFKNK